MNGSGTEIGYQIVDNKLVKDYEQIGKFKNGKIDGKGTFTWQDGKKYFGEW